MIGPRVKVKVVVASDVCEAWTGSPVGVATTLFCPADSGLREGLRDFEVGVGGCIKEEESDTSESSVSSSSWPNSNDSISSLVGSSPKRESCGILSPQISGTKSSKLNLSAVPSPCSKPFIANGW